MARKKVGCMFLHSFFGLQHSFSRPISMSGLIKHDALNINAMKYKGHPPNTHRWVFRYELPVINWQVGGPYSSGPLPWECEESSVSENLM